MKHSEYLLHNCTKTFETSCLICQEYQKQEDFILATGKVKINLSLVNQLVNAARQVQNFLENNPNVKKNLAYTDIHVILKICEELKEKLHTRQNMLRDEYDLWEENNPNNESV